jgi:hypothetical protein
VINVKTIKTINVTPDYRIIAKDALNIVVERLTIVLPPVGKPAPADFICRREWRELGNFGRTFAGLGAALRAIVLESAIDGLAPSSELAEFAASLKMVAASIDQALSPAFTVPLGAFVH